MNHMPSAALTRVALLATVLLVLNPVPWAFAQATPPAPDALFHQSFAVMKAVRYIHTVTVLKGRTSQPASTFKLRVAGDCDMRLSPSPSSLKVLARVQGAVPIAASPITPKVPKTNARFIVITSARSRAWERSARTQNRWARLSQYNPTVMEGYPVFLCPYAMYRGFEQNTAVLKLFTITNQGTETIHGRAAWHLVLQGTGQNGSYRFDFFIDQQTSSWLRVVQSVNTNGVAGTLRGDYSKFNQPVRIAAPKVGSETP